MLTTVVGTIEDSMDDTSGGLLITFVPLSTPILVNPPVLVTNQQCGVYTQADGSFSIGLESGIYQVTITSSPETVFQITVPISGVPVDIGNIITSTTPPAPVFPPYIYFGVNANVRAGNDGLEWYNATTNLWYLLINYGNPPQWGMSAGRPT